MMIRMLASATIVALFAPSTARADLEIVRQERDRTPMIQTASEVVIVVPAPATAPRCIVRPLVQGSGHVRECSAR